MKRLILSDYGEFDLVYPICLTKNSGIELQTFWDPREPESYPERLAYQLARISSLDFRAFHGPFGDLNCGSYDPLIRNVSKHRMELGYATAMTLQAKHIVFHHGYVPHTSPEKQWIPRFVTFWKDFLNETPRHAFFHLENLLEYSPTILRETIDSIGSDHVDACLDVGHAHCHSTIPVLTWIEELGERIGYVHLHDNHGGHDEHLAIGEGTVPYHEVCEALNHYAPLATWCIETAPDDIHQSYDWLGEHGYLDSDMPVG